MAEDKGPQIVLYDLARRHDIKESWSFNVWKIRLILNYKSIPYHTEWVDHQTIAPTFQRLGITPNTSGGSAYTVPTIRLPDGTFIRDSAVIAERLERMYPENRLIFDPVTQAAAEQAITAIATALSPIFITRIAKDVLTESSVSSWRAARESTFGMTLEELEATRGGKKAWKAADEPGIRLLHEVLTGYKRSEGHFIMGRNVSYGDLIIVAFVESLERIGEDLGYELESKDSAILALTDSCQDWVERKD